MNEKLKPCPFCGGKDIGYSVKTSTESHEYRNYHLSMYCKSCNCYGRRVLVCVPEGMSINEIETEVAFREAAECAWNNRESE